MIDVVCQCGNPFTASERLEIWCPKCREQTHQLASNACFYGSAFWTVSPDGPRRRVDPSRVRVVDDPGCTATFEQSRQWLLDNMPERLVAVDDDAFSSEPHYLRLPKIRQEGDEMPPHIQAMISDYAKAWEDDIMTAGNADQVDGLKYLLSRTHEPDKPGVTAMDETGRARIAARILDTGCVNSTDGIALTSASHPGNSGAIPVADYLTDDHAFSPGAVEEGETGRVEWRAPRPNECAPAVDAKPGSLHWIAFPCGNSPAERAPGVWAWWPTKNRWEANGIIILPCEAWEAGHRYLSPAEYAASRKPASYAARSGPWRENVVYDLRRDFPNSRVAHAAADRIEELEAGNVLRSRAAMNQADEIASLRAIDIGTGNTHLGLAASFGKVPVTPEMIAAAMGASEVEPGYLTEDDCAVIYRAMDARRPVPLVSEAEDRVAALERSKIQTEKWKRDFLSARDVLNANEREIASLRARVATEQPTDIDYNGPVQDGRAIPDPAHEQFHRAVGDVLAGKIIPAARRQMEDALGRAPKDAPTFPDKALKAVGLEKGVRVP